MPDVRFTSEVAIRGEKIFDEAIRPRLTAETRGQYVWIDVDTGDHLFDADEVAGTERMRRRRPGARIWFRRAVDGPGAVRRYGRRSR